MTQNLCLDTYDSEPMPGHLCLRPYAWTPMTQTLCLDTYDSDPIPGHL
jgi:hypothetical protein